MYEGAEKSLRSFDGTELGYRVWGEEGDWLVFINGLGSTYCAWEPLVEQLLPRWRILSWDLRGIFGSAIPRDRTRLTVGDHARDLEQIFEAEGIQQAVLAGWSMGVQLTLEVYRRVPERIRGLVLLNGTYGRYFSARLRLPGAGIFVPPALRAVRLASPLIAAAVKWAVLHPDFSRWVVRLGFITKESQRFTDAARNFAYIDWGVYLQMAGEMEPHDTRAILPLIRVPALVMGGTRDIMAPPRFLKRLASGIPGADLVLVPRGTHYTIIEKPDIVHREMSRFLKKHFG